MNKADELVEIVARALCAADGFNPDEHVVGGAATEFEDFGPRWQAHERIAGQTLDPNYVDLAKAAIAALSAYEGKDNG